MTLHDNALDALGGFLDEGWISEVLFEVKRGKEATVYCCAGGDRAGSRALIAAKVYRPLESRGFRNDAIYQTGRLHLAREGRFKRAAENKSAFGREVQYATWLDNEWETMHLLHEIGADVPVPLARGERAILMEYLGDADEPAPRLCEAHVPREAASGVVDQLLWNIKLMLHHHRVHGDLSAFNVMWWRERAIIIDFPQAIDPRLNPAARTLLDRDVENICRWAAKHGVQRDATRITGDWWSKFLIGEIG
jgi:RIO kinase 1